MTDTTETTRTEKASRTYSALTYEPDQFRDFVSDMGLSMSQQDALLEDIWLIVVAVIDAACGARQLSPFSGSENVLAVDSGSVLRSIIKSKTQRTRDAQVDYDLNAARKDS